MTERNLCILWPIGKLTRHCTFITLPTYSALHASEWEIPQGREKELAKYLAEICPPDRDVLQASTFEMIISMNPELDRRGEENRDRWMVVAEAMRELTST